MPNIKVTDEDIRLGTPSYENCPISRAAKRVFSGRYVHTYPHIRILCVGIHNGNQYELPNEAIEFAQKFDTGVTVEPFSFELGE